MLLRLLTTCFALTLAVASPLWSENTSASLHPEQEAFNICPQLTVRCVAEKDWMHPIGYLGKRPFCNKGVRCNQCDEEGNTWDCNREFRECHGKCEAYGPIPF